MIILTVTYRQNAEIEKFRHEHVEATAMVEDGETPEEALAKLKQFVEDQLFETEVIIKKTRKTTV